MALKTNRRVVVVPTEVDYSRNLKSLFWIEEPVEYNGSFSGVLLNVFIGVIRVLLLLPVFNLTLLTLYIFSKNFEIEFPKTGYEVFLLLNFFFTIISCLCVIFDCLSIRLSLADGSSFKARMPLAFISKLSCFNVHLLRVMNWLVLLIAMKFDVHDILIAYENLFQDFNGETMDVLPFIKFFFSPNCFATAIFLYVGIITMVFILRRFDLEYELSHPWIENWASATRKRAEEIGLIFSVFLVADTSFYMFFLVKTFSKLSLYIGDMWNELTGQYQAIFYGICIYFLLVTQVLYISFRNENELFLFTSFLFNSWFIVYLNSLIVIEEKSVTFEMEKFLWVFGVMLALHLIVILIFNPLPCINFVMWLIKYLTTLKVIVLLICFAAIFLIITSGFFSLQTINQELFFLELKWHKILRDFARIIGEVYDVFSNIADVLKEIIMTIVKFVKGILCYVLILALMLAILATIGIGFGASIGPEIGNNIAKTFQFLFKIFGFLRTILRIVFTVIKYALKAKKVLSVVTSTALAIAIPYQLTIYISLISIFPFVVSGIMVYFFVIERGSKNRGGIALFVACTLIFSVMNSFIIACIDLILTFELDLLLLVISFRKGWKLFWTELSYAVLIPGLILLLFYFMVAPRSKYNILDHSEDFSKIHYNFKFPGFVSCLCPLLEIPKNAKPDANVCQMCCERSLPCDKNPLNGDFERYSTFGSLKRIFCPCFYRPEEREFPLDEQNHRLNLKRLCGCRKAFNEEKALAERRDGETKILLDIKEREDAKLSMSVADTGGYMRDEAKMPLWKKICWPPGIRLIPTYLIPIFASIAVGYLLFLSVTNDWVSFTTILSKKFDVLINDNSNNVANGDVDQIKSEMSFFCPITDLVVILFAIFSQGILSLLSIIFGPFKELIAIIMKILDIIKFLPFGKLFSIAAKIIIVSPLIACVFVVIFGSVVLSMTKIINRFHIILFLILVMIMFEAVIFLPDILIDVLENIPLLGIEITMEIGYYYALQAHQLMMFVIVFLVVDHFAPIIPPEKEFDMTFEEDERQRYDIFKLGYLDEKIEPFEEEENERSREFTFGDL